MIAARTGDRETAEGWIRKLGDLDPAYRFGAPTLGQAAIAARLGEPKRALAFLRTSVSEGLKFGTPLHADPDLSTVMDFGPLRDFMRPEG